MNKRKFSILLAFEYVHKKNHASILGFEPEYDQVAQALLKNKPVGTEIKLHGADGIFKKYVPGKSPRRIANLLWMAAVCPFKILSTRADLIFVKTTPPLIQIPYIFWGKLLRRKVVLWLMDYHPVFEQRQCKGAVQKIAAPLSWVDKQFLNWYDKIICLDKAMQDLILRRCPSAKTCVYPTWNNGKARHLDLAQHDGLNPLRLLYSGNLGSGHSLEFLKRLLVLVREKTSVELSYCGNSKNTIAKFEVLAQKCGAIFRNYPRVEKFEELGELYAREKIHYGIVLLNDSLQGIVSPSKFGGYISFGLPILNLGPRDTNADKVCREFHAGLSWSNGDDMLPIATQLADPQVQRACAAATQEASEFFSVKQAENTANVLLEVLLKD